MKDHDDVVGLGIKMDIMQKDLKDLETEVSALTSALDRYKGTIGGIMLVLSLAAAGFTLFFNYIKTKL